MESNYGVVGFDFTSHRYKTFVTTAGKDFEGTLLGASGVSDWNATERTQLFFHTNAMGSQARRCRTCADGARPSRASGVSASIWAAAVSAVAGRCDDLGYRYVQVNAEYTT